MFWFLLNKHFSSSSTVNLCCPLVTNPVSTISSTVNSCCPLATNCVARETANWLHSKGLTSTHIVDSRCAATFHNHVSAITYCCMI